MTRALRLWNERRRLLKHAWLLALLVLCLAAAEAGGLMGALDNRLSEMRFASHARAPTGDVVLVDIDARSLGKVGVWPWPRQLYADLLSAAAKAGAAKVVFDIDFSSSSNPADDAAFAAALAGSGVETYLAAFAQPDTAGSSARRAAMPIAPFLQASWPVSVDVPLDGDGRLRRFPYASDLAGEMLASVPSVLSGRENGSGLFGIDYGIEATAIPRVSFVDLVEGRIDPAALAGRTLLVGASAVELHDLFTVPVFGTVSGSLVLALATETLLQHRELSEQPIPIPYLALVGIAALLLLAPLRPGRAAAAIVLVLLGTEAAALLLQQFGTLVLETARLHGLGLGLVVWSFLREFDLGRLRVWLARIQAANSENMLARVVDDSFDGILIVDGNGSVVRANAESGVLLGKPVRALRSADDLPAALRQSLASVLQSPRKAVEDRSLRQFGLSVADEDRILEYSIAPFWMQGLSPSEATAAGDNLHVCMTLRDVTEREQAQQRLRHLALHDTLTGLGNRRALEAEIAAWNAALPAHGVALLAFDLDRFKAINDTLGHGTGDMVLVETARRAQEAFGPKAFVARIGGDEFAVLLDSPDVTDARSAADRFLQSIRQPFHIKGHRISVASSVGIGWWAKRDQDATDMMRQADIALYRAKAPPAAGISVFENSMETDRLARLALEKDIERALANHEFELVYQPQVLLETAEVIGAEALVRWRHPVRGYVSPADFIPVAEEMGYIHQLGAFVLETACREAVNWPDRLKIAVNVSALQFEAGNIVASVRHALSASGLPARRLELEITESAFVAETGRLREAFEALLALGVSFALDDYGTGYSSLGYLRRFPISKLKIDRSFVTDAPTSPQAVAVLRSIVALGDGLSIRVIAEGIETMEQALALRAAGCLEGQGYLYSKPLSGTAIRAITAGFQQDAATVPVTPEPPAPRRLPPAAE